jgi:hypothetical protein
MHQGKSGMGIDIDASLQHWLMLHFYTIILCLLPEFFKGLVDPTVGVDGWWPCLANMGLEQYW